MPLVRISRIIDRKHPQPTTPTATGRAGACAIELDIPARAMAGYSVIGRRAHGAATRMFARALYLEAPSGQSVAFCVCDLLSGTRFLFEAAAEELAAVTPIAAHNLFLMGTHTHSAPGAIFGASFYDAFAQNKAGFDEKLARSLARQIANAVRGAYDDASAREGEVSIGWGEGRLWGASHNRSLAAFRENEDAGQWHESGWPGHDTNLPTAVDLRSVDPRVRVMLVQRGATPVAVFGTFGCHATALGPKCEMYHHDWPGYAAMAIEDALATEGARPVVALGLSASGDTNGLVPQAQQGDAHAQALASKVCGVAVPAIERARASASSLTSIVCRDVELRPGEEKLVDGDEATRLARDWAFGTTVVMGAEDSAAPFSPKQVLGSTFATSDPPQHPKESGIEAIRALFELLVPSLDPSPIWNLHSVRINDRWLLGLPAEPTTMAATRIERAVADDAWLVGYCNGYNGYVTTEEEFNTQHYEGASSIWGRNTQRHVGARFAKSVADTTPSGPRTGVAVFSTVARQQIGPGGPHPFEPMAPIDALAPVETLSPIEENSTDHRASLRARVLTSLGHGAAGEFGSPVSPVSGWTPGNARPASGHDLASLRRLLDESPDAFAAEWSDLMGREVMAGDLDQSLDQVGFALAHPDRSLSYLDGVKAFARESCRVPPSEIPSNFPDVRIDPCSRKYQGTNEWIVNCGYYFMLAKLRNLPRAPFVAHSPSRPFRYEMKDASGEPLPETEAIRIALVSDFGGGEYHSEYIARWIGIHRPRYVIHLGDVYYAGTRGETIQNLENPLRPLCETSGVFVLNANHEMTSGGFGYFEYLLRKRAYASAFRQEQEGSYFVLVSDRFQLIAIETSYDYWDDGRIHRGTSGPHYEWVKIQLERGRDEGKINILLSQHEAFGLGESKPEKLFRKDLFELRQLIDYWFWGDEHYCAHFGRNKQVPFIGTCIGHAGYPVEAAKVKKKRDRHVGKKFVPPAVWVDDTPKFPSRHDVFANGFVLLTLHPNGEVEMDFRDWRNHRVNQFRYP